MEELVPRSDRRRRWRSLSERLDLGLPELQRHPALKPAIGAVATLIFAAGCYFVWLTPRPVEVFHGFFAGSLVFAVAALLLTRPLAIHFSSSNRTVRGVVLRVLASNLKKIVAMTNTGDGKLKLHPDQVWEMLRSIVVEQLDVSPDQVKKKTRFVKDLGVG
jgi:hypothetical protein